MRKWSNVGFIVALFAGLASMEFSGLTAPDFIVGADMSHLVFFENRGVTYKDAGQTGDALQMLKKRGVNCVRLRLFTSSAAQAKADPYNYTNNLDYTLPLAVRVKNAGISLLLDFHYSDTWADPQKQTKPAAWTNLAFPQLVQQIRSYSSNMIVAFKNAGAMPEYVQVGNEITGGMLWPDGANTNASQWSKLAQLLNAGIQGVKDASGTNAPKIIIHIDRGGDWNTTKWYFDNLVQLTVPFDIIGQSYYPWWHGSMEALQTCLTNAASRYNKPILIAETAFPWSNSANTVGFPATTNGQVDYVVALAKIVKSIPNGRGAGIVWWGTEYQQVNGVNTASFEYKSFFRTGGNILPAASVFGQLAAPALLDATLDSGHLKLNWPLSGAGMALTTSPALSPAPGWTPVTNPVQSTGGMFSTSLTLDGGDRFFRLESN